MKEVERAKLADALRKMSAADKVVADRVAWSSWLGAYQARLQQEADAGANSVERIWLMNSTNPRWV